jgi:Tat protein secretion system quality control protein TatD with DNase activity
MVAYTYAAAATIKAIPLEEVAVKVEENYRALFSIGKEIRA